MDVLPNFELIKREFDCGSVNFHYEYAYECLPNTKEEIGDVFVGSLGSGTSMGFHDIFLEKGINLPIVGAANTSSSLADKSRYPMYVRTTNSFTF